MDISDRAPDDPVRRFFRVWVWIALVASMLLFVAQFVEPLAATRISRVHGLLFPITIALYCVILIRGRYARGSHLLAGVVAVLMVVVFVAMLMEGGR
jgi:hypothetical protein